MRKPEVYDRIGDMMQDCKAIRFVSPESNMNRIMPPDRWQPLEDHLKHVAELTRSFADEFGTGDWGYLAGL